MRNTPTTSKHGNGADIMTEMILNRIDNNPPPHLCLGDSRNPSLSENEALSELPHCRQLGRFGRLST